MIRRPPRSTLSSSSAASDVYKRQVYGGLIDDALRQARAANADLWVVEAGTNGPFAEASRISGDTRELVSRVYGVERAGSVTYQSVQTEINGAPHRLFLIGFEPGRPGGPR